MTQTALDEFARRVRYLWHWLEVRGYEKTVESVVRQEIADHPNLFGRACNDPEYIAFCKEQDRKEDTIVAHKGDLYLFTPSSIEIM